jgi:hypothetical protein
VQHGSVRRTAAPPRRRTTHLTGRDLTILKCLVTRRVETLDYLHETHFESP